MLACCVTVLLVAVFACVVAAPAAAAVPTVEARLVPMRDGTRLAIDVWRPAGLAAGARVPTIVTMERYRRAVEMPGGVEQDPNFPSASAYTERGYAYVIVDARGTGASFGTLTAELGTAMIRDFGEVVDWVAAQPWSDGRVGATGTSYSADTAIKLAGLGKPQLEAIAPLHYDFDPYEDEVRPGGLLLAARIAPYAQLLRLLDGIPGADCAYARLIGAPCAAVQQQFGQVKPVDGPDGPALRGAALAQHVANVNLVEFATRARYRDDTIGDQSWTVTGVAGERAAIQRSGIPILTRTGWLDAGSANGVLSQFTSLSNPQESWIGPWNHGADQDADPFKAPDTPVSPGPEEQFARVLAFFDTYLKRATRPRPGRRVLHYYTFNEGRWRTTTRWPVAGTHTRRLYLAAGHRLTAPLAAALRVTGLPRVTLAVSGRRHSRRGQLHAYLEHVAPGGRVTYLTEGQLGLEHRALAATNPAWRRLRTPRTYARADARPLPRGREVRVTFDLQPTSVRFRRGDRIRLAIAGANPDSFEPVQPGRRAAYRIGRSAQQPSFLTLPIVAARRQGGRRRTHLRGAD
jgi:predicted acyl esterase